MTSRRTTVSAALHPLTNTTQRWLVCCCHLLTLTLLALHLYVRTLPPTATPIPAPTDAEAAWWGLWPVTYAPTWAVAIGVSLIIGLMLWQWWWEWQMQRLGVAGHEHASDSAQFWQSGWFAGAIALLLLGAFFLFPFAHTRWGDAYLLAKGIAWPDPALRTTHSWQAPLDVFLHSQVWLRFGQGQGWQDAMPAYRLLSPLAGALYLAIAVAFARDERFSPGWLTFGLLTSLGLLQLFFGYVENYSFAAAGVLAYLWLGIGVLQREKPLWVAATVLAITNAFHPSTVVLAPSLLYLGWWVAHTPSGKEQHLPGRKRYPFREGAVPSRKIRATTQPPTSQGGNHPLLFSVFSIVLPMVIVASGTILLMEAGGHGLSALWTTDRPGGGDARWLVPLWQTTTRWEHYTLFSWLHLRDWLNGQLLVAPVVGTSFLLLLSAIVLRSVTQHAKFLGIATSSYLLFTWLWNPDYGGQRDWDLFSLATLPVTLLFIYWLARLLPNSRYLQMAALPLIVLQSLHTAAWVYQNTLPWQWPP